MTKPTFTPADNAARLRNLVNNARAIHIVPWLQTLSFDQLVEAYWRANALKADEIERNRQQDAARAEYARLRAGEGVRP